MEERKIKIFKSFEEQEADHLNWMKKTTALERFTTLFKMQQYNAAFFKKDSGKRNIIIHHGYFK